MKKEDDEEEETQKYRFIINHEGNFKVVWDWVVLIMVIFTAIQIPYNFSFLENEKEVVLPESISSDRPMLIITVLVDCMFILDIFINFRTTFIKPSSAQVERKPKELAVNYLKTWFLIDLLAAIPFDWFMLRHNNEKASFHNSLDTTYTY